MDTTATPQKDHTALERFFGIRAEMPRPGAPELTDLELYLAWREQGLPVEAPGVRR